MDAKALRMLIEHALSTNFDFLLKNALSNFQVRGFNSILLHRSDDLVLRLYVCEPGQSELANSMDQDDNTLLIHNHRFYFMCQTLVGWMSNLTYSESTDPTPAGRWFKYGYRSALTSDDRKMHLAAEGVVNLSLDSVERVDEGSSYEMQPAGLHKILVPSDRLVVMLFWEHAKVQIDQKLYSRYEMPESTSTEGTNLPFEESELRRVLNVVVAALKQKDRIPLSQQKKGLRIGITGSVACGKSTAVQMLAARGVRIIKVDDIVHQFLQPPNHVYDMLVSEYGRQIIGPDGAIVRSRLAGFVFADDQSRRNFEFLFYPHVIARLDQMLAESSRQDTAVESAMLFEWKLESRFDEMWCVSANRKQQIARHMKRNGIGRAESIRVIESQWPQKKKEAASDVVIHNTKDLAFMEKQVDAALAEARYRARS